MKNLILVIIVFISFNSVAQVTSITGTADQVITSGSTGSITLSLPQNIGTTSSPQFTRLVLGGSATSFVNLYNTKPITGSSVAHGNLTDATIQSDVINTGYGYTTRLSTQASSFTIPAIIHYMATQGTIGSGSAVTTQSGFRVSSTLTGATNNTGFRGDISAATGRWNIFMGGSAQNYLAGRLGIGITVPTEMLDVVGNGKFSGNFVIGPNTNSAVNFYNTKPITGSSTAYGNLTAATILSSVTDDAIGYRTTLATQASSFTLSNITHFWAVQSPLGAGSAVTNQYGFRVGPSLIGATNNYGIRGEIPAGTGRWNLYMSGTASNYLAGNLGIGTTTPAEKLSVNGNIRAKEVKVETANWPDYVFHKTYSLQPLSEVERFIQTNQHLPGIPAASVVKEDGLSLGDMNVKLLEKIEELTLHLISQGKRLNEQNLLIKELQEKTGISKK